MVSKVGHVRNIRISALLADDTIPRALLSSEVSQIFHDAPCAPNDVANDRVREAYAKATGKDGLDSGNSKNRRMPGEADNCPVCYETMHNASQSSLTFCDTCGNAVHRQCFQQCK